MSYLLKLQLWFGTYITCPSGSNVALWAPDSKVKKFFEISWFSWIHFMILEKMKSCLSKVQLEFWAYGLIRLLGPGGPNIVSGPQTPRSNFFFWDFMISLDSFQDSWENEVLFMKSAARVLDVWLDKLCGPKWLKCSFWAPDSKVKIFFEISWFYWIHFMILEKMRSCLWKMKLQFWTNGLIIALN